MTENISRTVSPPPGGKSPVSHTTTSIKSDSQGVVDMFVSFCEKQGVNVNEYDSAMKLCVLLSLSGVDTKRLCQTVIPDVFIDWANITPGMVVFGSSTVSWIDAMQFFTLRQDLGLGKLNLGGVSTEHNPTNAANRVPCVLLTFSKLLEQSGIILSFEHIMRLFVLCSVTNQPMNVVVYHYTRLHQTTGVRRSDTHNNPVSTAGSRPEMVASNTQAQTFVGKYVDNRVKFESDQCYEGMLWVLTHLTTTEGFMQFIKYHNENRISIQNRMKLRAKQVFTGRLRLRDRLSSIEHTLHNKSKLFDDTFDAWCIRVRFPNNISMWLKQKIYFLCAQTFDVTSEVNSMVSTDVAKLVMENMVNNPEVTVIDAVIERMRFHTKPFPMMQAFHSEAFTGLSKTQIREIHNPMVMKLYVASYQKKNWRLHWLNILPESGMNHTIITHVERFVASNEICGKPIMEMLRNS
jgi:hypothetical protein